MKQNFKRFFCIIAAMAMLCIFCATASAQSAGLMKALNVKGQAKIISFNDNNGSIDFCDFSFTKKGTSSNASNSSLTNTTLSDYGRSAGCEITIKNGKWYSISFSNQAGVCNVVFTAFDASGRPIKADLYYTNIEPSEMAKRGAKVTCSGNDAKGNWTKMVIDRSGLRDIGVADIIPGVIKRTIKYW